MLDKPDLIVFSQNLLGGGASFHRNMVANFPPNFFNIRCIYLDASEWNGTKPFEVNINHNDHIFTYGQESQWSMAKRLSKLIPDNEGAIIANLEQELIYIDIYRKQRKTVFFICHDAGFLPLAIKYQSVIDVFIAHNSSVYTELLTHVKGRSSDIHFIQHGVSIVPLKKQHNEKQVLRLVFLARHYVFKGIFDLPEINTHLLDLGVQAEWTILGDGPDKPELIERTKHLSNFSFDVPATTAEVMKVLEKQDIFILPSRADGLPVALLEAMSVGCVPVIANFSEGIKKVVTADIGYVLPVGKNALFAEKIAELDKDRSQLKLFSDNCVKKVSSEFDIKKQALKYFELYINYKMLRKEHTKSFNDLLRIARYRPFVNKVIIKIERLGGKKRRAESQ